MKNFLHDFAQKFETWKKDSQKKRDAQIKRIESFQKDIVKDLDQKIQNITKRKKALEKTFSDHKEAQVKKLKSLRSGVLKEFDKQIEALTEKKDLIKDAITNKLRLKKFKISSLKTLFAPFRFKWLFSAPFIYGMIIPMIVLHICLEIYHRICFRLYSIPLVNPKDYFAFDRRHLPYLNLIEKINCAYCSYYNCLIAYAREIGARTERFWCPIKHANRIADEHNHYEKFFEYLDAQGYREKRLELREFKER